MTDLIATKHFKAYCKQADPAVTTIQEAFSEASLDAFKDWVASPSTKVGPEGRKPKSISHVVKKIKYMIEWAHRKHLIDEMPRNLKEFGLVHLSQPEPETLSKDEFEALYEKADGRGKLYLLLALNCGYTQMDIATLERWMVDFETGIITRKRHKTIRPPDPKKGVPQHSKLWPRTLDLLRKEAAPTGDLLLKSSGGGPLLLCEVGDDGKVSTYNSFRSWFKALRKGITTKTFSDIRNTGATLIMNQYRCDPRAKKNNQQLFDLYLAHTPHKMVASYLKKDWSKLFLATDWLSTLFQWEK